MDRTSRALGGKRGGRADTNAITDDETDRDHVRPAMSSAKVDDMAKIESQIAIWP